MYKKYGFIDIDKIKRFLWYCKKTINESFRMLTKFNDEFWQKIKKNLKKKKYKNRM